MSAVRILSGYTIFGIWVDDINTLKQAIESHGGRLHADSTAHVPENAEHKFATRTASSSTSRTHGWDGAKKLSETDSSCFDFGPRIVHAEKRSAQSDSVHHEVVLELTLAHRI
jgi:hypothetical protein